MDDRSVCDLHSWSSTNPDRMCPHCAAVPTVGHRPFDTTLPDVTAPVTAGIVGSITFAPNKNAPCYDPAVVLAQAEVERLREGNRKLLDENNELKAENARLKSILRVRAK